MNRKILLTLLLAFFTLAFIPLAYGDTIVFGPEVYTRGTGKPQKIVKSFSVNTGWVPFAISVKSGNGKKERVSSAVVEINGQRILNPEDFSKEISEIIAPVKLKAQNEIAVEVRGEPGSFITVTILGNSIPEISGYADPDYVNLNVDTTVTIVASLRKPDPNSTPSSVNLKQYDEKYRHVADLGILYYDGTLGDYEVNAGTYNDFTTQVVINEPYQKMLYYRVSALYKKNDETLKKVLSDFFSINVANIPSVTGVISPQGGTITLEGYASVIFPAGAFAASQNVTVSATSSPGTQENYEHSVSIFEGGPRLPHEVRINSGNVEPATSLDVVLNIPDSFINTLPLNTDIQVFAQIDQGDIYNFELFDSTFDSITKTIRLTLPMTAFTEIGRFDKTYEAIVIVGTTLR